MVHGPLIQVIKILNEANQINIEQVNKDIVSKMKYPKYSIHFVIKFEEGDVLLSNISLHNTLLDALK